MKQELIMDALNMLDDRLILETDEVRGRRTGSGYMAAGNIRGRGADGVSVSGSGRKYSGWIKWAAAACFVLVLYAGGRLLQVSGPDTGGNGAQTPLTETGNDAGGPDGNGQKLPMLSVPEDIQEDMGYEGYVAGDIAELVNANPWNGNAALSTLPVFKNRLHFERETGRMTGGDFDAMKAFLLEIAAGAGLDTSRMEITDNAPDAAAREQIREKFAATGEEVPDGYFDPSAVLATAEGITIEVDEAMTGTVTWEQPVSLPAGLHFCDGASREDLTAVAEYLKDNYMQLPGMKDPQLNLYGGGYNMESGQTYHIEFYEGADNLQQQILNYHFRRVAFYENKGKLYMARIFQTDLSGKTGDYPVITDEKARELLLNGHYITTVPYEMPGEPYIAKTELVYRNAERETYYMPYYRFYVELPEEKRQNGLKTYGAYYVPAVEPEYISNMPVWDGQF